MFFPVSKTPAEDPLQGVPEKQIHACALRYGERRLMPYKQIADRLGNSRQAAYKLVKKGTARIRANGYGFNSLALRAFAA